MINGKNLAEAGFRYLGVSYSQMDCQAFVEQCLRDCGLEKNLAGSNAWFREVSHNGAVLTPEECVRQFGCVPAGAFLFILTQDGGEPAKYHGDGLGNASHIGIATGRGEGAIHSSASRGCVAESKFRGKTIHGGWNRVGLWNRVAYDYGEGESGVAETSQESTAAGADAGNGETGGERTSRLQSPVSQAVVWAANGRPVNTRSGPGKGYALSKAGKLAVGTAVEILKRRNGWCRIRVTDEHGAVWYCWMTEEFLKEKATDEDDFSDWISSEQDCLEPCWTVTIRHISRFDADLLKMEYPDLIRIREGDAG